MTKFTEVLLFIVPLFATVCMMVIECEQRSLFIILLRYTTLFVELVSNRRIGFSLVNVFSSGKRI